MNNTEKFIINELESLIKEIKKHKTFTDFKKAVRQSHLTDLSNPKMHRWGRAIPVYTGDRYVGIDEILKDKSVGSYLIDIKYEYPKVYKSIVSSLNLITIYRAVPKSIKKIDIGDYVALDEKYALGHLESVLEWQQKIKSTLLSMKVPKEDVIWGEADFAEWVYSPKIIRDTVISLEDFYNIIKNK